MSQRLSFNNGSPTTMAEDDAHRLPSAVDVSATLTLQADARTQRLLRAAGVGLWDWDLRSDTTSQPPKWKTQPGNAPNETIDQFCEWLDRLHPNDRELALVAAQEYRDGVRDSYDLELRLKRADGSYRWILAHADLVLDASGTPIHMTGSHIDISRRRSAEEAVREREHELRLISDMFEGTVSRIDRDLRYRFANSAYERLFGVAPGQVVGRHVREVVGERLFRESAPHIERALNGESVRFETHFIAFGKRRVGLMRYTPDLSSTGEVIGVCSVGLDITDLKQAELALGESEERLRLALDATSDGVWDWSMREDVLHFSPQWCRLLGYAPDEAPGTMAFFLSIVHPDDLERVRLANAEHLAGRLETKQHELRLRTKSGEYRWFLDRGKVVARQADRQPIRMVGTISDITEGKQAEAERQRLEAQLRQAQKMESIGRLAGGIAHDFNNMLGIILGHTDLALDDASLVPSVRSDLIAARSAATRSADIVRQLLAFARQQSVVPVVVDLNERIGGMLSLLGRLLGEDILLTNHLAPDLWPVRIDPSQIDQVLTNLCVNARKAIAGVGTLTIETSNVVIDAAHGADHAAAVPGEYVRMRVVDNGCGMDEATLANIFEPFFTTSVTGEGIGLGLATVFGVVTQNRGFVQVTSAPGAGATFEIHLPRYVDAQMPIAALAPESPIAPRRSVQRATILMVEDEPALLAVATRMLEAQGYQVLRAGSPVDALRIVEEQGAPIDLLITDVIMPGMNGYALAQAVTERRPGVRVLYMSGYPSDVMSDHGVLADGVEFLQKPFLIGEFLAKVSDTLAKA